MSKYGARISYSGYVEEYGDTEEEAVSAAELRIPLDADEYSIETFECDEEYRRKQKYDIGKGN